LDALTREQMQGELVRVWETLSPTALFITHQVDEAIFLADEVIVLSARPAKVLHRIRVPFDRPRHLDLKRTREFHDLEDLVWEKLQAALPARL
jgi:NitT/TauT family transport system ATP-binding protein